MNISSTWPDIRIKSDDTQRVMKFIFTRPKDAIVEAVLYRYPDYRTRTVICCSTQSGCPVGCRFCGTGNYFVRSLTAEEIVAQPVHLLQQIDCSPEEVGRLQIMFMSMGEPLLNLKALVPAMEQLHALYPRAALLVSTSGPRVDYGPIVEVSQRVPTVGLQFSVHESTDDARNRLVPFSAKLTLMEMAVEGHRWADATGRRPFFNYCAHEKNSSEADADRLARLFSPETFNATVSVVCESSEDVAATNAHQRGLATGFAAQLVARGFDVRVFDPAGQDTIGGGCGQLWFVQKWMREHPERARPSAGHGRPVVHAPGFIQAPAA